MADIYLGPTIAGATLLPPIRWTGGGSPAAPVEYSKSADKSEMLSGVQRYHPKSKQPRRWQFAWEMLTVAEMAAMLTLNGYDTWLYFQNTWESDRWRHVVISGFDYDPVLKAGPSGCRFNLSMTLEEVQ